MSDVRSARGGLASQSVEDDLFYWLQENMYKNLRLEKDAMQHTFLQMS